MCVHVFLMLSGVLISMKVLRGKSYSWPQEAIRRYLRLSVPIFGTSVLVIFCQRAGLLWNLAAAPYAPTDFLGMFYETPIPLYKGITLPFVQSIFLGDSSLYGPLWMIPYIFYGTFFSIILSEVARGLKGKGQTLLYLLMAAAFLLMGGYYVNFYLGNLIAFLLLRLEERRENGGTRREKLLTACAGAVFLAVGIKLALDAFILAAREWVHLGTPTLNDANFWLAVGGAAASFGFILLWEALLSGRQLRLAKPILWVGERSYSVFLTHWLVICTFSSWFYLHFYDRGNPKLSIALNFVLSLALTLAASHGFYELLEKRTAHFLWNRAKRLLKDGNTAP